MSFWIIAIALLGLALAILLIPLLRATQVQQDDPRRRQNIQIAREQKSQLEVQLADGEIDQAGFDNAYLELQTALALELERGEEHSRKSRGKWMAVVVILTIPVASISLYLTLGEYRVIGNPELALAAQSHQAAAAPQMSFDEMEIAIQDRLRNNPEDEEGWFMLGRVYMARQQYPKAVAAYRRSAELKENEPGIIFALADALAMQNDGQLLGEPEQLVVRGLELAPLFPNGLWLAGMAAEQRGDYRGAHRYWTKLMPLIRDNPDSVQEIGAMIAMLEQRDPALAGAGVGGAGLKLVVDISDELRSRVQPDAAVFVYARAMQGPPMPLAARKIQLADLPASLTLGDADAMIPTMKLSSFDRVVVGARVSFSGNPVAQSGDFYTEIEAVDSANPQQPISLTIDRVK